MLNLLLCATLNSLDLLSLPKKKTVRAVVISDFVFFTLTSCRPALGSSRYIWLCAYVCVCVRAFKIDPDPWSVFCLTVCFFYDFFFYSFNKYFLSEPSIMPDLNGHCINSRPSDEQDDSEPLIENEPGEFSCVFFFSFCPFLSTSMV